MSFRVILTTPDKTWYDGQVESLVGPGLNGRFGVLERHAPMIIAIDLGLLALKDAGGETMFVIEAGVAEVSGDQVVLSVDDVRPARDASDAEQKLQEMKTTGLRPALGA